MHFHLKTGGVTTVIRQQVEALKGICDTLVLTGQPPETGWFCETITIPGIGYDSGTESQPDPVQTAGAVMEAIQKHWKNGCDILHVHNPTLAKNKNYLNLLKILKKEGVRLFLQIHDFAEDGRPLVYFNDDYVPDCHYGVINSRDYDTLIRSGLKPQGLHLVGNMVTPLPAGTVTPHLPGPVLYPIRAIRRKNIGEAILLSTFFPDNKSIAITLPPNSPADFPAYDGWKRFVARFGLNVEFEAGLKSNFITLVHAADSLLTTSISEGFGFSFMEPWTAGKFLWGRDLTGITDDFKITGLRLGHLYTRMRIPVHWVVAEGFFETWQKAVHDSLQGFRFEKKEFSIREAFERLTSDGTIDFGLLNEKFQQLVVQRLIEDDADKAEMIALNPFLADCGRVPTSGTPIDANRELVTRHYSSPAYRHTLTALYKKVIANDPVHAIDKQSLLEEFFDLKNFSLLKWGPHDS
ncbi:MAG: glycosyltransferase family 4 protein [Desulfobacterales bacterium]|nr:glycosyltransferase family 4 protein [Desulfobacterales bacterium]